MGFTSPPLTCPLSPNLCAQCFPSTEEQHFMACPITSRYLPAVLSVFSPSLSLVYLLFQVNPVSEEKGNESPSQPILCSISCRQKISVHRCQLTVVLISKW